MNAILWEDVSFSSTQQIDFLLLLYGFLLLYGLSHVYTYYFV